MTNTNQPNPYRPNVWGLINIFLQRAITKGLLIPAMLFLIIIAVLFKIPNDQTIPFLKLVVHSCMDWHIIGWILSILLLIGWTINNRFIKISHR